MSFRIILFTIAVLITVANANNETSKFVGKWDLS